MKKNSVPFKNQILVAILLPVLVLGIVICLVSTSLITPPLMAFIQKRIDLELTLASRMGMQVCEKYLNYLLDLRLEDDREMNHALRREAIAEIKALNHHFQSIHLLVIDGAGRVAGASEHPLETSGEPPSLNKRDERIVRISLWGKPIRASHRYFPFWDWHVAGYIHDKDYQAPLILAKRVVYIGTFGVLAAVWLVLLIVIKALISYPLERLSTATQRVAAGRLSPLPNTRKDEIGRVVDAFNTMVDGLKRKDEEVHALITALQESQKRYRDLIDGAVEGILVTDAATQRFRYANPAICRMLGYSAEALAAMSLRDIHPPEELDRALAGFEEQTRGAGNPMAAEVPCLRSDGAVIYMDIKATGITMDGIPCNLGFFTDVTARKRAESEHKALESRLNRSEKMQAIGLLAGGVAHDLNNILSGLVSYPELLLIDLPSDSPLRGPIKTIERSGKRATAIVQDLLTLARRGVAVSEVVNLNRIVNDYLASPEHGKLLQFHANVVVSADLDEGLMNVKGSPIHLSKCIMNLVSNAAEATEQPGGRITISTRNQYVDRPLPQYEEVKEGDYVVLTVADPGIGIDPDDLKRIFEPFYSKKVMGRSGTGLGMAVVWGTVKDHNGYIDVTSIRNRGSTFDLYFPITRDARDERLERRSMGELTGRGETILVVDDVAEQREIATRMLTRLGYRVESVSSGEAAVEYIGERRVDLLILDMIMDPGMDGLDTLRQILQIHPGQNAIVASGYSESDRVREAQRLGAVQYVKKPYTLECIGTAVKNELESTRYSGYTGRH